MSFRGGPLKHERSSKLSAIVREGVDKTRNIPEHEKIKIIFMKKKK